MNAQIAITKDDGTLSVMTFVTESHSSTLPEGAIWLDSQSGLWRRDPTDANIAAELKRAFPPRDTLGRKTPQPVRWTLIDPEDVPKDRTFRNAWRHDGRQFFHDMDHARRIHLEHIRHARLEHLGRLDRDWMRATGQGRTAEAQALEAQRQALRDAPITLNLEGATTPEDLQALWPEGLPR